MPYRRTYDETSLESFLDIWNWRVVSEALATAQRGKSIAADGSHIFIARGGQASFPKLPVIKESMNWKLRPDWDQAVARLAQVTPQYPPRGHEAGQQMEEQQHRAGKGVESYQ